MYIKNRILKLNVPIKKHKKNTQNKNFWIFVADFILLTWVGQKPVRNNYILLGQIATLYYFIFFLVLIPLIGIIESKLVHYKVISN